MFVEAEIWTIAHTDQGNAVLIKPLGTEIVVPIFIGQLEAQSILIGLGNVPMPRPLTHDLFLSMLKRAGMELLKIEITELREGTFYAQLVLNKKGKEIVLDARPSDSIAIAVRKKCPIFIAESVIDETGITAGSISKGGPSPIQNPREKEIASLERELKRAVEIENYEKAALIRDKLQKLSQ